MRRNTAHRVLRRFATSCFVMGILALLATPLALAQSSDVVNSVADEAASVVEVCNDGFQPLDDGSGCFDFPVIVTTQAPVECEVGMLSPDSSTCFTEVQFIGQAPIAEIEVIDATITENPGPAQERCATGFTLIVAESGLNVCSAMVQVSDTVTSTIPGLVTYSCPDGSDVLAGNVCAVEGAEFEAGVYIPAIPAVPGIPAVAGVPAQCPSGTNSGFVVDGLCATLGAAPMPTLPDGSCGELEIRNPVSYASGGVETFECIPAQPQTPAVPGIPATPGIPAVAATCNGEPTTGPASSCVTPSETVPAIPNPPAPGAICPPEFTPKNNGTACSMENPKQKVTLDPVLVENADSITCPAGYEGPSANNQCSRTILTAQPDIPVCSSAGTLLNLGNGFVCLLDNRPIAPPPLSMPSCPKGDYDPLQDLCIIEFAEPVVVDGPLTDALPIEVNAIGDPATAPVVWTLDLASTCNNSVTIDVLTADTLPDSYYYQELPLLLEDEAGVACTYTLTALSVPGWENSLPPGGIQFTPSETGVPFAFIQFTQVNYGEIRISKQAFGDPANLPAAIEVTVSGICLDSPITSTIELAGESGQGFTSVAVPRNDTFGTACNYVVQAASAPGYSNLAQPSVVMMNQPVRYVSFAKVQQDVGAGTIRITKTAEGDAAAAPDAWEFIVESYDCLEDPLTVTIDAAGTFTEPGVVAFEVPFWNEAANRPCEYSIRETPVDGFINNVQGYYYVSFYEGTTIDVTFNNVSAATATASIELYVSTVGADGATPFSVSIASDCLSEPIERDYPEIGSFFGESISGLQIFAEDGSLCTYNVTSAAVAGVISAEETVVVTLDRGYSFAEFNRFAANVSGQIGITKASVVVDGATLPEVWEFTVTSPCFDPIVVEMPTEGMGNRYERATIQVDVLLTDDTGLCEITVTQTPVEGFASSPPVTQTAGSGSFLYSFHEKITSGTGILSDLEITVRPIDDFDLPSSFVYNLTSPCLDEAMVVEVPTGGHELTGRIDTIVPNLPVEVDGERCGYSITPFEVAGFDQLISFGQPFLGIDGSRIELRVGPDGAFGDEAAMSIPTTDPTPIDPPAPAPTPTPGAGPAPTPTPDAAPTPTPAPGADPAPTAVPGVSPAPTATPAQGTAVVVASTSPKTGVIATAPTVNFGGTRPSTPANLFGATHATPKKAVSPVTALAHTGGNAAPLALFGILMILVGSMATVIARREEPALATDPFWHPGLDT